MGSSSALDDATQADLATMLRQAVRNVASSVAVVTTADSIGQAAMTMTSTCTLSMDPPSMLICVNRQATAYPILLRGADFCVNYLAPDHEEVARICSDREKIGERLSVDAFDFGGDLPSVRGAGANVFCRQDGRYLYGTHAIVIGRVFAVRFIDHGPLVYCDGSYRRLALSI